MLSEQLQHLKKKANISTQKWSELSGVPVSTISRLLSGQTDNPSFQSVCDLVYAVGGSVDEMMGKHEADKTEKERSKADLYELAMTTKNQWIHRLFVICCILIAVCVLVILYFIWDATHPAQGIIKY